MKLIARPPLRLIAVFASLLCVFAALAGAVPAASAATSGATASTVARLSPSYLMNFDNLTYSETSTGSLSGMSVSKSGDVSGEMTVNPPLYGTSALSGTLKGDTITFTAADGDYTGTVNASTQQISGTYTYPGQNGVWKATPASQCDINGTCPPPKCTKPYEQPASWDTERVASPVPGIAGYIEPINVIISACSTVPLSDIEAALGNWSTVSDATSVTFHSFHFKCISPEKADVAGRGYVTQDAAWRLKGCVGGNVLSVTGLENHVRIWNQPSKEGDSFGAWFITASYETACVSIGGKLYSFFDKGSHITSDMHFFHCVDGGAGTLHTNGYDRGAQDLTDAVAAAAHAWNWNVSVHAITRPISDGQDVGEDGAKFDSTVYVLTVTLPANP
jgi:hypothetical protein